MSYKIHVGKTNKGGKNKAMTSAVAVEFENAKDAMFAQVRNAGRFLFIRCFTLLSSWCWKVAARMESCPFGSRKKSA